MTHILDFHDDGAADHALVGGKGANLGVLTRAGFPVPAGFTVTTTAYQDFLAGTGLVGKIASIVDTIDFGDANGVEAAAGEIRALVDGADMPPEVAHAITTAYGSLGDATRVAVRSSGTAEDLADASFAGQHDTYLHIVGTVDVIDAVKRCWASLWTARATAYRHHNGFGQDEIGIAVVVQTMVDSEVSGVMFTANPMTTSTEEIVINSSWGLGEGIVSGITQPDEFILDVSTLGVRIKRLGEKRMQVVRDPVVGSGTVESEVPADLQARFSLSEDEVTRLGQLGRKVTDYYGGFPQDTEWAFAGGELYLLQSRPITGAAFSWDSDVEPWQKHLEPDAVWTRSWADAYWGGGATPLMYSYRARAFTESYEQAFQAYGVPGVEARQWFTYYKGVGYYNANLDALVYRDSLPRFLRPYMLDFVTPEARETALAAPFSLKAFLRWHAGGLSRPDFNLPTWLKSRMNQIYGDTTFVKGLSDSQLRDLPDRELLRHQRELIDFEVKYCIDTMPAMWHGAYLLGGLMQILDKWYSGDAMATLGELVTGTPKRTASVKENLWLWELAGELRSSASLRALFEQNPGAAFFTALEESEEGQAWLARYREFAVANYHRGHADRDIYYPRRCEDPSLDYNALKAFLSTAAGQDPEAAEHSVNARREAAAERVRTELKKAPLGGLKAQAFTFLHNEVMKMFVYRDDERYFVDYCTMSIKRSFLEINRRLLKRGVLSDDRDFYFLGEQELYDLFRDGRVQPLTQAKITARRANFEAVAAKSVTRPEYLQHYKRLELDVADHDDSSGVFRGVGTAPGTVTGKAHIVKHLSEIGDLRTGEILICNSTDPGWTPVFLVISGVVIETGGLLAHASCLAREYGFPAVQLSSAMDRIPDGATITVNGETGEIRIEDDSEDAPSDEAPLVAAVSA